MTDLRLVWNERNFDYVFRSWEGPVGQDLDSRCTRLKRLARGTVGVQSGDLRRAVGVYKTRRGKALEARVGANPGPGGKKGYGLWHHDGTRPHRIEPTSRQALKFAHNSNQVIRASAQHPGTRPNKYLTRWLREVVQ